MELCCINPSVAGFLCHVKKLGLQIAVLSDTYLSAGELRAIMESNRLSPELIDYVFTSSEQRVSKGEGKLFQLAVNRLGIQINEMLHFGDNEHSDYHAGMKAGVPCCHYRRNNERIDRVQLRERLISRNSNLSCSLNSVRALAQGLCAHLPAQYRGYFEDGAFLFGPVLARYADWCVGQFRDSGIRRVLAFMREGELLGSLIRNAATCAGVEMEVIPVFISRQATRLAAIGQATFDSLYSRAFKRDAPTIRQVLETFGIDPVTTGCDNLDHTIIDENAMASIIRKFCSSPFKEVIEQQSADRRKKLIAYFAPFVLGHPTVGVVDLGYNGSVQHNLQRSFGIEGVPVKTVGCYLSTRSNAVEVLLDGVDIRSYVGSLGSEDFAMRSFTSHPEIFEESVISCIGSTEGYEMDENGNGRPVLGIFRCSPEEQKLKQYVQEGILAFQKCWLSIAAEKIHIAPGILRPELLSEIDSYSFAIMHRLFTFPLREEVQRLGNLHHDDNNGIDTWNPICDDNCREALRSGGLIALLRKNPYWPQGVIALETPEIMDSVFNTWIALASI